MFEINLLLHNFNCNENHEQITIEFPKKAMAKFFVDDIVIFYGHKEITDKIYKIVAITAKNNSCLIDFELAKYELDNLFVNGVWLQIGKRYKIYNREYRLMSIIENSSYTFRFVPRDQTDCIVADYDMYSLKRSPFSRIEYEVE
ncbi:MAG: hypothetical protein WCY37_06370 [Candidatus Dojkabacteria bacterium]